MNVIEKYEAACMAALKSVTPIPTFAPGDTVRVYVKVKEGDNERMQAYEGVCIARRNRQLNSSFTVRKISYGEGVERVFPLFSPNIKVEVVRRGEVRRAKLYYIRNLSRKKSRIAEKAWQGPAAESIAKGNNNTDIRAETE